MMDKSEEQKEQDKMLLDKLYVLIKGCNKVEEEIRKRLIERRDDG